MFQSLRRYLSLIKSLQTGLLLVTGLAGYLSAMPLGAWAELGAVAGSLCLAISGSTVLNMVYDRDIDAKMKRTCWRPLPSGQVDVRIVFSLGLALSAAGVMWALAFSPLYGAVVFAGLFFDAVVYTVWLKRRTPYSILIGGLSGGMPVLAGRALATGQIEPVGGLLALAVLCWIPTHILTYNLKYLDDYCAAGVPTFPAVYGFAATRRLMVVASLLAAGAMLGAALLIGITGGGLHLLLLLGLGLLTLATLSLARPSERVNVILFKYASVYMLASMLVLSAGA